MEIKTKDIVVLLELNKKKAELEFKKAMMKNSGIAGSQLELLQQNLEKITQQAKSLDEKIKQAGVDLILPNGTRLREFNREMSEIPTNKVIEAMRSKSGDIYTTLAKRGEIIKANYENRGNIAKISLLVACLDGDRKMKLFDAISKGALSERIGFQDWDDNKRKKLAKLLNRIGVNAGVVEGQLSGEMETNHNDVPHQLSDRMVWVSPKISEQLSKNLEEIRLLNPKIQLKTAERQIRAFSEDEEKDFMVLQGEYLKLLKEQDDLLREFEEEDRISFQRATTDS